MMEEVREGKKRREMEDGKGKVEERKMSRRGEGKEGESDGRKIGKWLKTLTNNLPIFQHQHGSHRQQL